MGVLVFTGRQPHASSGYGAYEPDFDVKLLDISNKAPAHMYQNLPENFFKGRINLPMYCGNDNIPIVIQNLMWWRRRSLAAMVPSSTSSRLAFMLSTEWSWG
jgi:hypothetical protein